MTFVLTVNDISDEHTDHFKSFCFSCEMYGLNTIQESGLIM